MFSVALLAALAFGQSPAKTEQLKVLHDGEVMIVEGERLPNGNVRWYPDRPFNQKAIAEHEARKKAPRNFGLDPARTGRGGESYRAPSPEARAFVAEATRAHPESDADPRLHLTVIGPDADREAVLRDLDSHPALAPLRAHLLVQGYAPGDWAVRPDLGFQAQGKPSIVLQQKGGRVVWRALDYSVGPEGLAQAIRRADPSYKPAADPGPATGGEGCPLGFTKEHRVACLVAAVVVLLLWTRPRKGGDQ